MTTAAVVGCVPDLMDRSKVAAAFGDRIRFVARPDALIGAVADTGARLVLVDLTRPGALEAVSSLCAAGLAVVAFGPHVDDERLSGAAGTGAEVLARSVFFRRLSDLAGTISD